MRNLAQLTTSTKVDIDFENKDTHCWWNQLLSQQDKHKHNHNHTKKTDNSKSYPFSAVRRGLEWRSHRADTLLKKRRPQVEQ